MNFYQLDQIMEQNIQFGMFSKDGTIVAYANGRRYVYVTDAVHHDHIKRTAKYKPGEALDFIKTLVDQGRAEMIEPKPSPEMVQPKLVQQSLF